VARTHRCRELLVVCVVLLIGGCGWLPPDTPPAAPTPPDPDAAVLHDWKVAGHVLGARALISDADGAGFHGRTVSITGTGTGAAGGYASPWSGRCDDARRRKQPRTLAEVAAGHDLAADRLGLTEPIVEYQLLCATNRTPALTIYVAGAHALTCWSGVCYLLVR
jgi:hypothetical protein